MKPVVFLLALIVLLAESTSKSEAMESSLGLPSKS
jgi:hypothetical protein